MNRITLVGFLFLAGCSLSGRMVPHEATPAGPRVALYEQDTGAFFLFLANPVGKKREAISFSPKMSGELVDLSERRDFQRASALTAEALEDLTRHDPSRQWLIARDQLEQELPKAVIATVGDTTFAQFYRACLHINGTCIETPPDPCGDTPAASVWAVSYKHQGAQSIGLLAKCFNRLSDSESIVSIYKYHMGSSNWEPLIGINEYPTEANIIAKNMSVGPPISPNGSLSILIPAEDRPKILTLGPDLTVIETTEVAPITRDKLPLSVGSSGEVNSLAMWLSGSNELVPRGAKPLLTSWTNDNRRIVFYSKDIRGTERVCRIVSGQRELCSDFELTDGNHEWSINSISSVQSGRTLSYVYLPASFPTKRAVIAIQGGPFYSGYAPSLGFGQILSGLGYSVVIPMPTGGDHGYDYIPTLNPNPDKLEGVTDEIDELVRTLESTGAIERPIFAASSAGVYFLSKLRSLGRGYLLDSPACFPELTLETGHTYLTNPESRKNLAFDGGVAESFGGNSGNACADLVTLDAPVFGLGAEEDPFVGREAMLRTALFVRGLRSGQFDLASGSYHGARPLDVSADQVARGLVWLEAQSAAK